jgi:hypothetical protein
VCLTWGAHYELNFALQPRTYVDQGGHFDLTGKESQVMCLYVQMLDLKFPELQDVITTSKAAVSGRLVIVEDKVGAVMAGLGYSEDAPGGPYVNV